MKERKEDEGRRLFLKKSIIGRLVHDRSVRGNIGQGRSSFTCRFMAGRSSDGRSGIVSGRRYGLPRYFFLTIYFIFVFKKKNFDRGRYGAMLLQIAESPSEESSLCKQGD